MKIAIDLREGLKPKKAGKGFYVAKIWEYLQKQTDIQFIVCLEEGQSIAKSANMIKVLKAPAGPFWHLNMWWKLKGEKFNLFLAPTSFILPALLPPNKSVVIVHDLAVFHKDIKHQTKAIILEKLFMKRAIRKAKAVVTDSEATKKEVVNKFGFANKVISIPLGPTLEGIEKTPWAEVAKIHKLDKSFILFVGSLVPRKNILNIIKAYLLLPKEVRAQFDLVLAGNIGWGNSAFKSELASLLKVKGVRHLGYVSDNNLVSLYKKASVLIFPSFYEGFGFPVLDAMSFGCPVITAENSSLSEVGGSAAVYVDPYDTKDMAQKLAKVLLNKDFRSKLSKQGTERAKKFSWQRHADKLMEVFNTSSQL